MANKKPEEPAGIGMDAKTKQMVMAGGAAVVVLGLVIVLIVALGHKGPSDKTGDASKNGAADTGGTAPGGLAPGAPQLTGADKAPIDLGLSLKDDLDGSEKAPKVVGVQGGKPVSGLGIKMYERVFSVDGRPVNSVKEFETAVSDHTRDEIVLKVGLKREESRDVKVILKK